MAVNILCQSNDQKTDLADSRNLSVLGWQQFQENKPWTVLDLYVLFYKDGSALSKHLYFLNQDDFYEKEYFSKYLFRQRNYLCLQHTPLCQIRLPFD